GLVVIGASLVPFVAYLYAPLGAGDRVTLLSAFGGALVWTGLGIMCWRWRRAAVAGAVVLSTMALAARVQRTQVWTTAAGDAARIVRPVRVQQPVEEPSPTVVLGPAPVQQMNIAAFLDQSNVAGMLQYVYGRTVPGGIAYSVTDFQRFAERQRVD